MADCAIRIPVRAECNYKIGIEDEVVEVLSFTPAVTIEP
jgi:hypothetical protein